MKSQKIIPWFVSLLLISIFSGCDKLSQRTSTLSLGTQTLPFTVTIETKEKISTLTPSPTTPPIFATAAAVPTLKAEDANKRLLELLEISGDCHLPCWWGIIPEKTTSQDAAAILNSFSTISLKKSLRMDHGSIRLQVPNGIGVLSPYVEYDSYNDTVNLLIIGMSQLVLNNNGGYDEVYDDPAFAQAVKPLMLSEILKSYGQPEEILVSTYSLQPLGWTVLFDVQLFYPEHGFLIVFHSLMEFTEDGYIMGCPIKSNISMGIWEPKKYPALDSVPQNIRNNISAFSLSEYLRIDEATDMSIQDFYNLFKDNETLCLKTPPGVWHFPGY